MKITVIGHAAKDVFYFPSNGSAENKGEIESWGGILYSLITLSKLMSNEDTIYPVFGVSDKEYDSLMDRLQAYPNIQTKGLFQFKEELNQVHYFKTAAGTRTECSKHIAASIPFSKIKPFLDTDGVLINMASGFDITLETLDYIRMHIRDAGTPVHFDFHSLTLGIDNQNARFRRPLTDWRRWCFMTNSIQLSEEEAAGLSADRYDEPTLINQLMPLMVNALMITRGGGGATLIRQEHKKLFRHEVEGISTQQVVDTTGCGDVFGAAFFYQYLKSHDFLEAVSFANALAAYKATFYGVNGLDSLQQHVQAKTSL